MKAVEDKLSYNVDVYLFAWKRNYGYKKIIHAKFSF